MNRRRFVPPLGPGILDQAPSPYGPDPLVFGPGYWVQRRTPGLLSDERYCPHCGVRWYGPESCFACTDLSAS